MDAERTVKKEKHQRRMQERLSSTRSPGQTDIEIQAAWGRRELMERLNTLQDEIITVQDQIENLETNDDDDAKSGKIFWTDKPE